MSNHHMTGVPGRQGTHMPAGGQRAARSPRAGGR